MSADITSFIRARLDELERAALAATQGEWSARRAWPGGTGGWEDMLASEGSTLNRVIWILASRWSTHPDYQQERIP